MYGNHQFSAGNQYGGPPPFQVPQQQQQLHAPVASPYYGGPAPSTSAYPMNPAPGPNLATDANAFAQMFKSHLASLTFNSKPIITNVTIIAQEYVQHMAVVVVQCIEEHILNCPPSYRLPALYALDSICKNIGPPYTTMLTDRIVRIYMETYRIVDQGTKVRMEELLNTWRNSGQNGEPIFGGDAQWKIETQLYGRQGPPIGQRSTIDKIDRLLNMGAQDQIHNPQAYDAGRMEALSKLKSVVQTAPLSSQELAQIDSELGSFDAEMRAKRQIRSPLAANRSPRPAVAPSASGLPPNLAGALANLANMGTIKSPKPQHSATLPQQQQQQMQQFQGQQQTAAVPATQANDLIKSLMLAGLLKTPTPQQTGQDDEYTRTILSTNIILTAAELSKEPTVGPIEELLNRHLSRQCPQCGNRYPAGDKGQAAMDAHRDWHFRQNQRVKDSAVRGQSRSWFSKIEQWIRGGYDDTLLPSREEIGLNDEQGQSGTRLTAAQEEELRVASSKFVVADGDASCPICKEKFHSAWSEEKEEFIWRNAIKTGGKYYHATCHLSATTLSSSIERGRRADTPVDQITSDAVTRLKNGDKKRKDSPSVDEETQESPSQKIKQES